MLKGKLVSLTSLHPGDKEILFGWINDAESVRMNAPFRPVSWQAHSVWFENHAADANRVVFGIRKLDDDKLIGSLQFSNIHNVHRSAELSIRIGAESDRNKGLGTEALRLGIQFVFKDLNLCRISLTVFSDNDRAVRAYEKAGFVKEGLMRNAAYIDGAWKDVVLMALLRQT